MRYLPDDYPRRSPVVTRFVDDKRTPEHPGFINTLVERVRTLRRRQGLPFAPLFQGD